MTEEQKAVSSLEAGGRLLWSALRGCAFREFRALAAIGRMDGYNRISFDLTEDAKRDHVEAMLKAHMPNSFPNPKMISLAFVGRGADERAIIIFANENVDRETVSRARAYMQSVDVRCMLSYPVEYRSEVSV